jgi:hypothetical protein
VWVDACDRARMNLKKNLRLKIIVQNINSHPVYETGYGVYEEWNLIYDNVAFRKNKILYNTQLC